MIIIDSDVTDPNIYRDPSDPKYRTPFAVADHMITNPNGSTSFVNADGSVVGQAPMQYGVREDAPSVAEIGVYQMFRIKNGVFAIVQTRSQDPMYIYTFGEGGAFL